MRVTSKIKLRYTEDDSFYFLFPDKTLVMLWTSTCVRRLYVVIMTLYFVPNYIHLFLSIIYYPNSANKMKLPENYFLYAFIFLCFNCGNNQRGQVQFGAGLLILGSMVKLLQETIMNTNDKFQALFNLFSVFQFVLLFH